MSNELTVASQNQPAPFGPTSRALTPTGAINQGAVAIEQERAIAEARGQIQVAQMFPRDVAAARAELMDECDVFEFAQVAFYAVPRAGGTVTGPSIRMAEACASAYGHMEWGHRELSRGDGKSEVEVYAWDKQKNNRRLRQITVDHFRDTKNGPVRLRDSKDIDDKIANIASKQMRGAILALVPKSFVEAASARCKATLAGGGGVSLKQRIEKMTDAFAKLGVTADSLKKHLKKALSEINGDDIADLTAIYNAIKGGDRIADHFGVEDDEQPEQSDTTKALAKTAQAAAAAAPADAAATPKKTTKAAAKPAEKAAEKAPEPESNPVKEEGNAVNEEEVPPASEDGEQTVTGIEENGDPEAASGDTNLF